MCVQISASKHVAVLKLEIHYLSKGVSSKRRKVRGATGRIDERKLEN